MNHLRTTSTRYHSVSSFDIIALCHFDNENIATYEKVNEKSSLFMELMHRKMQTRGKKKKPRSHRKVHFTTKIISDLRQKIWCNFSVYRSNWKESVFSSMQKRMKILFIKDKKRCIETLAAIYSMFLFIFYAMFSLFRAIIKMDVDYMECIQNIFFSPSLSF